MLGAGALPELLLVALLLSGFWLLLDRDRSHGLASAHATLLLDTEAVLWDSSRC